MLNDIITQFLNSNGWIGETASVRLVFLWIIILLSAAFICFLVGEITQNLSQVDKLWSLMPIVYGWVTLATVPSSPRLWIMTVLVTLWGLRLSYNFYRKGGYHIIPWKGEEDYRWGILRKHPFFKAKWRFTLFNLVFISLYQHTLIFLFSLPLLFVALLPDVELGWLDYIAGSAMLLFIAIETWADNQLYNFHLQKQNKIERDGKFDRSLSKGFMIDRLWKYVRHPNFAAEQGVWISFYFFGVAASAQWLNWTVTGPVLLVLLFIGSSEMTERISMTKYPDYRIYKQRIPKFIPRMFKVGNAGKE
jgi:steroid 5-alpha reductase family enzyme